MGILGRGLARRLLSAAGAGAVVAACGSGGAASNEPVTVRLGYIGTLTQAPALVGVERGLFTRGLRPATLRTQVFNAGPAEITGLLAGALDAAFVGPTPAINGFVKSDGQALRIVAGAAAGGAGLVVRADEHIVGASQLRGRTLATPQLGNTQDVALRAYLRAHGLVTDPEGGGDVRIVPTDNATTLQLFSQKQIDGAWVPEPYLSRLVVQDGGTLLVDEATLWPQGRFPTTTLVVTTSFLEAHPDAVRSLVRAGMDAVAYCVDHPSAARAAAGAQLVSLGQKTLPAAVVDSAWARLRFTVDPVAASLARSFDDAKAAGLVAADARLKGIVDLRILNELLRHAGLPTVSAAGLGDG